MSDDTSRTEPDSEGSGLAAEPLRELMLGRSKRTANPPGLPLEGGTPAGIGELDLESIAAHCRAKAAAARWASEHLRRIRERCECLEERAADDPAMIEWADRLLDSFYWANSAGSSSSPDISALDHVGGCFETLAEALALVVEALKRRGGLERALALLAEAQSSLRQSLAQLQAPADPDQLEVYEWVRVTAARHRVFLKRYMRADDLADPARWSLLLARIEALAGSHPQSRRQRAMLDELRSHVDHMDEREGTDQDWQRIIKAVEELVADGLPPSNRQLRDLLLPVVEKLPETVELPAGFQLVLREIDRYLATRGSPGAAPASPALSALAQEAARLLSGRSLVLIGGVRRPGAQKELKAALGLKDLIWIETKVHQSIKGFESAIARMDVALVLLAIRWSSHAFGDVKQFCDQYGKPLVRLPGGYGPNQVAAQIITQVSGRLGGR